MQLTSNNVSAFFKRMFSTRHFRKGFHSELMLQNKQAALYGFICFTLFLEAIVSLHKGMLMLNLQYKTSNRYDANVCMKPLNTYDLFLKYLRAHCFIRKIIKMQFNEKFTGFVNQIIIGVNINNF